MKMQFTRFTSLALLSLAPVVSSITSNKETVTGHDEDVALACDSSCVHRLLYKTGYASSTTAIKHTMYAYDAFDWCMNDNQNWCPEAINTTTSDVAGMAVNAVKIDFNNCEQDCMVKSLNDVASQAAVYSMQWAEGVFNSSGYHDKDRIDKLHRSAYSFVVPLPLEIDSEKLNDTMTSHHAPDLHKVHSHDKDKDLAIGLPFLAAPVALLAPFAAEAACGTDPILCAKPTLEYAQRLFAGLKKALPKSNWLRFLAENEATGTTSCEGGFNEWVDPLNPDPPADPWSDTFSTHTDNPYGLPHIPEEDEDDLLEDEQGEAPTQEDPAPGAPEEDGEPPVPVEDEEQPGEHDLGEEESGDAPTQDEPTEPTIENDGEQALPSDGEDESSEHDLTEDEGDPIPDSSGEPGEPPVPVGDDESAEPPIPIDENSGEPPVPIEDAPETPSIPGEPAPPPEPVRMFRAERFDVFNNRLEQQTLRQVTNEAEAAELLKQSGRYFPSNRFQPFQQLDSEGNVLRTVWRNPAELQPMEGEWERVGSRFLRVNNGVPALDGMGAPLVADAAGTMLTLEPAVSEGGTLSYAMFNAGGMALDGAFDVVAATGAPVSGMYLIGVLLLQDMNAVTATPYARFARSYGNENATAGPGPQQHVLLTINADGPSAFPSARPDCCTDLEKPANASSLVGTAPAPPVPLPGAPPPVVPFSGPPPRTAPFHSLPDPDIDLWPSGDDDESKDDGQSEDDEKSADGDDDHKKTHHDKTHEKTDDHKTSMRTSTSSTPTTFSTTTKSHKTTSMTHTTLTTTTKSHTSSSKESQTSTTSSQPSRTIGNLPEECVASGLTLDELDKDARKECDKKLADLSREEKKAWVNAIYPPRCLSGEDWNPVDPDKKHGKECYFAVHTLTNDERRIWIAGMLPLECPYDKVEAESEIFDLDHDMEKRCKDLTEKFVKSAWPT